MGLTLFSEPSCGGTSKELTESEVNITKVGVKFAIKSAKVDGNPWILFSEERYQGFLAYLEEGTYNDLTTLGLPTDYKVASVKYKKDSLAHPQIKVFNSSSFKGDSANTYWGGDSGSTGEKMKSLDVGLAGVWVITINQTVTAVQNMIMTVDCRCSIGRGQGTGLMRVWALGGLPSWARCGCCPWALR